MITPAEQGARTLSPEQAREAGYGGYAQHMTDLPCPRLEDARIYCATCQGSLAALVAAREAGTA